MAEEFDPLKRPEQARSQLRHQGISDFIGATQPKEGLAGRLANDGIAVPPVPLLKEREFLGVMGALRDKMLRLKKPLVIVLNSRCHNNKRLLAAQRQR